MKRGPHRAWPRGIVEVRSTRPDPRATDPQATQKISREQLEEALRRTKSGTRAALRSDPLLERAASPSEDESFAGPRDDGPEVTIVGIDTMELDAYDLVALPAMATGATPARPTPLTPPIATPLAWPRPGAASPTRRLHITPQLALLVGLAAVAFVTLAAIIGFFAGRVTVP